MARDLDRNWREQAAHNPLMNPHHAYEEVKKAALMKSKDVGESGKEPNSIRVLYPSWQKVRNQFYRQRRKAGFSVPDPFNPPEAFQVTYRGFEMEDNEKYAYFSFNYYWIKLFRWIQLSNRELGIIIFASNDDLRAAAECTLLMGDGTFEICPIGFAQLYTMHGLVSYFYLFQILFISHVVQKWVDRFCNSSYGKYKARIICRNIWMP